MKKIGEVELRGDRTRRIGTKRTQVLETIRVGLSEDTVKGKKGELEEVKDRQERILEKGREEQWESIRERALAAGDRRENSWR